MLLIGYISVHSINFYLWLKIYYSPRIEFIFCVNKFPCHIVSCDLTQKIHNYIDCEDIFT